MQVGQRQVVGDPENRWKQLERDEAKLRQERDNLVAGIAAYGPKPEFQQAIQALDERQKLLAAERSSLERLRARQLILPASPADLREKFVEQWHRLSVESPEFGDILRRLVPKMHIYLVRLCDGGHLLPRALIEMNLGGDFPDVEIAPDLHHLLTKRCTLDLFEPPLRERIRPRVVQLTADDPNLTLAQIAERLPEKPSEPVVGQALRLHARMQELGLSSPYALVTEPPADMTKIRRYKHPRYRFEPIQDYERPPLE